MLRPAPENSDVLYAFTKSGTAMYYTADAGQTRWYPRTTSAATDVAVESASVVYVGFWVSLGVLFSILFRRTSSSALTSIVVWIFFTFFIYMIASVIADQLAPVQTLATAEALTQNEAIRTAVMRISPSTLFEEIATAVLNPSVRSFGFVAPALSSGLIHTPLSLSQSLLIVWPEFVGLIVLMLLCFLASYVVFMRQEIRSL